MEVRTVQAPGVAVLVDFDNVVPGDVPDAAQLSTLLDRIVAQALDEWSDTAHFDITFYGGWLEEGVLTRRASDLQAAMGSARFFPLPHPARGGLLRGSIQLATRLVGVPEIEWAHTQRERRGLPRLRFRDGRYPLSCAEQSSACPLRAMRNLSKSHSQRCNTAGCSVTSGAAFRAPEQKMVDVMIACDVVAHAGARSRVMVLSSDLDVLPAVAMASKANGGEVAVLRVDRYAAHLYDRELERLGVRVGSWEGV